MWRQVRAEGPWHSWAQNSALLMATRVHPHLDFFFFFGIQIFFVSSCSEPGTMPPALGTEVLAPALLHRMTLGRILKPWRSVSSVKGVIRDCLMALPEGLVNVHRRWQFLGHDSPQGTSQQHTSLPLPCLCRLGEGPLAAVGAQPAGEAGRAMACWPLPRATGPGHVSALLSLFPPPPPPRIYQTVGPGRAPF